MKKLLLALATVGALAVPGLASAQVVVGPTVSYHDDADFGVGAFVMFPLEQVDPNLSASADFGYFFPDGFDYWEINGNLIYRFTVDPGTPVLPFALGGLNIGRFSVGTVDNTEIGLNLGGGVEFPSDQFRPMVGAKIELEGGDGFVLFGSLGFPAGS